MTEAEIAGIGRRFMGAAARPTMGFAAAIAAIYIAILAAAMSNLLSLWVAFPLAAYVIFMAYTPLHESVHRNICGRQRHLIGLNDAIGYVMASILGFSFAAHKWAHREHHLHTNTPDADPDHVFNGNPWHDALLGGVKLVAREYRDFFQRAYPKLPASEQRKVQFEIAVMVGWRALLALWFPTETLLLCVLASIAGVTWLVIIFAWVVHIPFDETARYRDTSTYLLPKRLHRVGTWFWLWQNYHSIHHLFPRVPFYRYDEVFDALEGELRLRGTPIHQLSLA